MLSSNLNKQAQSGSPGAEAQLLSKLMRAEVPSAMLSTSNVLPINSDETGNNCKFDIPGLATSSFVTKVIGDVVPAVYVFYFCFGVFVLFCFFAFQTDDTVSNLLH